MVEKYVRERRDVYGVALNFCGLSSNLFIIIIIREFIHIIIREFIHIICDNIKNTLNIIIDIYLAGSFKKMSVDVVTLTGLDQKFARLCFPLNSILIN